MRAAVSWVLALALLRPPLAIAGQPSQTGRLYTRAQDAYRAGRFEEAARLLREVYALAPDPILLYNLGRALDGAGDLEAAAAAYERYLAAAERVPNRGEIQQRIGTLRRLHGEQAHPIAEAAPAAAPPAATAAPPARSRARRAAPWILSGSGALALGAGGIAGALAWRANGEAIAAPFKEVALARQAEADRLALGANVSFAIGGVALAGGLVWTIVEAVRRRQRMPR